MHVQITDGLSVGDQESDCDDDDRRELISHYANDKYLNKWEVAEEEEEIEEERDWRKVGWKRDKYRKLRVSFRVCWLRHF